MHLLRQIYSHIRTHTQPQSQGLCGVTKATETQELIIVTAIDSGIKLKHTYMDKHTEQLSIHPSPYRLYVTGHHSCVKMNTAPSLIVYRCVCMCVQPSVEKI